MIGLYCLTITLATNLQGFISGYGCGRFTACDCWTRTSWQKCTGNFAIGNPERHGFPSSTQSSAQWQLATIEIMRCNRSYSCFLAPRIHIFVLRAHPVRGESHNQRNTTGEVATTSPPFYYETHRSHFLCVKAELGTTFTSWSQHHSVAIGNPERHVRKASHRGSKQQQRSCVAISLIIAFSLHAYIFLFFAHIPLVVNHTINGTPPERLQQ